MKKPMGVYRLTREFWLSASTNIRKAINPRLYPLVSLVAIVLMLDIIYRLVPSAFISDEDFLLEPILPEQRVFLGDEQSLAYLSRLADFDVSDAAEEPVDSVGEEVDKFDHERGYWDGDLAMYRLIAVLKGEKRVALIEKVDKTTGRYKILKVSEGEHTKDFRVDRVDKYSVYINTGSGDAAILRIFERRNQRSSYQ